MLVWRNGWYNEARNSLRPVRKLRMGRGLFILPHTNITGDWYHPKRRRLGYGHSHYNFQPFSQIKFERKIKMESKPDFIKMEKEMLALWEEGNFFNKLREKNKDNQRFRFIDGPITANNPMGIHHAWGRSVKDIILRYKAMQGHTCHYRNGFDTRGFG